jgi:hypothetical protein
VEERLTLNLRDGGWNDDLVVGQCQQLKKTNKIIHKKSR